ARPLAALTTDRDARDRADALGPARIRGARGRRRPGHVPLAEGSQGSRRERRAPEAREAPQRAHRRLRLALPVRAHALPGPRRDPRRDLASGAEDAVASGLFRRVKSAICRAEELVCRTTVLG